MIFNYRRPSKSVRIIRVRIRVYCILYSGIPFIAHSVMCADYIDKLIQPIELVDKLESVLRELEITGDIQPLRHSLEIPQPPGVPNGYFLTMPAYVPPLKCFGVKILTLYPSELIANSYSV